ncbi:hypothetical protein ACQP2U_43585 (plasmid) [Nocardia sp. CA-084685]|uniref:hypothetical protein n=1 Tax=Nocardia sp. CA-084685 TaxID=3239970 RepID=UPI003D978DDE
MTTPRPLLAVAVIAWKDKTSGEIDPDATAQFGSFERADQYFGLLVGDYPPPGAVELRFAPPHDPSLRYEVTADRPTSEIDHHATARFAVPERANQYRRLLIRSGDYTRYAVPPIEYLPPPAPGATTSAISAEVRDALDAAAACAPAQRNPVPGAAGKPGTSATPTDSASSNMARKEPSSTTDDIAEFRTANLVVGTAHANRVVEGDLYADRDYTGGAPAPFPLPDAEAIMSAATAEVRAALAAAAAGAPSLGAHAHSTAEKPRASATPADSTLSNTAYEEPTSTTGHHIKFEQGGTVYTVHAQNMIPGDAVGETLTGRHDYSRPNPEPSPPPAAPAAGDLGL